MWKFNDVWRRLFPSFLPNLNFMLYQITGYRTILHLRAPEKSRLSNRQSNIVVE